MRIKVSTLASQGKSNRLVSAVGWSATNELYACTDEKIIERWNVDGTEVSSTRIVDSPSLDAFITDFSLLHSLKGGVMTSDVFCIGAADGTIRIFSSTGRLEKQEKAHTGAVTAVCWNYDGSALLTAGEDGSVKQYSRSGNLRSKLSQADTAVYAVAWSPDNNSIAYAAGRFITIKSLSTQSKPLRWKAHDGSVLKIDWNAMNGLLVSGGEDGRYKVWDSYGLLLFSSKPLDYAVTSVAWAPSGDYFAVGSFNLVSLCDRTGWVHSRSTTNTGSLLAMSWSSDGTHLALAAANGRLAMGQIVERRAEWKSLVAVLQENNNVVVRDVTTDAAADSSSASSLSSASGSTSAASGEELEFGSRVVDLSLSHNHLVVATAKSAYIYSTANWTSPQIVELKSSVSLILQSERHFLLVDKVRGLSIYNYDGRLVSNPKLPSLMPHLLRSGNVSISVDALAVIDRANPCQVYLLDVESGKQLADPIVHHTEIAEIALNSGGLISDRKLMLIDRNRDLYITQIHQCAPYKLAAMVESARWHESNDQLAALADAKLLLFYYPNVVYVDRDLLHATKSVTDVTGWGKNAALLAFSDSLVTVRRADGASQSLHVMPYAAMLYRFAASNAWGQCTRLARVVHEESVWAVLAGMALHAQQLDVAEQALAAIEEVDKLQYVQYIKTLPSAEARQAELFLYRRQIDHAEALLLQADSVWRAILMNVTLFRWSRALELAFKYKTHVDTVLGYRQRWLAQSGKQETEERWKKLYKEVPVDWDAIQAKLAAEQKKEDVKAQTLHTTIPVYPDLLATYEKRTGTKFNAAAMAATEKSEEEKAVDTDQQIAAGTDTARGMAGGGHEEHFGPTD